MRRYSSAILIAGFFLILTGRLLADPYPDRRVLLPYQTVATAADLWALRYNPSALAADDDLQITFAHTYTDSDFAGNDLYYMGKSGAAVGIEWIGSGGEPNARHYTLALGKEIKDRLFLGVSYRHVVSDDSRENKAHFWTTGLMIRPGEHFSIGVRAENLNHMPYEGERTDAIYTYSAGLNFADGKIVFGADYHQGTGQKLADGSYHLSAAVEPVDGLIVFGDYGDRGRPLYGLTGDRQKFGIGVRLNITELMVSSYNAFNHDGKFFQGNFATGSFRDQRRSVVRRREIADVSLGGQLAEKPAPRFFFLPDARRSTTFSLFSIK